VVVSPRALTTSTILKLVWPQEVLSVSFLSGFKAETLELVVPQRCRHNFKKLKDLKFPRGAILGAIMRDGTAIVPVGDNMIKPHDRVMIFAVPEAIPRLNDFFEVGRWGL